MGVLPEEKGRPPTQRCGTSGPDQGAAGTSPDLPMCREGAASRLFVTVGSLPRKWPVDNPARPLTLTETERGTEKADGIGCARHAT